MFARALTAVVLLSCAWTGATREAERERLFDAVAAQIVEMADATGVPALSAATLEALLAVPRHEFVPANVRDDAYQNRPLPIGYGQTISQPLIVALMTEMLQLGASDRVLEIGTGSAYQAAVLAEIVDHVYTIEIIEPLATAAAERLERLDYANVSTRLADGYYGWPEHGPFDAIIVTAAAGHVPPPLIEQLKPGGRMAIPVGGAFHTQQLLLIARDEDGSISTRQILPVRFVPLTGDR